MKSGNLTLPLLTLALWLAACATRPPAPPACAPCPACPRCATADPPPAAAAAAPSPQAANWADLPGWADDDHAAVLELFRQQCATLAKRPLWQSSCASAAKVGAGGTAARAWFERELRPWQPIDADDRRSGLITGYYEPEVRGSRRKGAAYTTPVFGPPDDLVVVDLAALYPELKHLRLRGRLEGRRLVPYFDRADWTAEAARREAEALLWIDDPLDFFFLQIQGSGQVLLDDGSRVRIGYAEQNGHPYRSIGKWLIEQGELQAHEASMQGIRDWAARHPQRLSELLNANPSLVFFRELAATGSGPPGALGVALTPQRSLAVDPRHTPLGAPVWLATTAPDSDVPIQRLMLAQDTGGAIRGPLRADFYWGSGAPAGELAGRMKQRGRLWVLLPHWHRP